MSALDAALEEGFFSQVEVVGVGRRGTSGHRHVDGSAPEVHAEPHHERHGRVLRSWVTVTAESDVVLEHVSSFTMTGVAAALGASEDWEHRVALWSARNPWSGEHRWSGQGLGDLGLYDVGMTRFGQDRHQEPGRAHLGRLVAVGRTAADGLAHRPRRPGRGHRRDQGRRDASRAVAGAGSRRGARGRAAGAAGRGLLPAWRRPRRRMGTPPARPAAPGGMRADGATLATHSITFLGTFSLLMREICWMPVGLVTLTSVR